MLNREYTYRPPVSPTQHQPIQGGFDFEDEPLLDMNDGSSSGSSVDLNDFDSEIDLEDSEDGEELIYEDKAIEYSEMLGFNEEDDNGEEVDDCQIYIQNYVKKFQYSDDDIRNFCKGKTKEDIQVNLKLLEDRLVKLKETANGSFTGLDQTIRDSIFHQLALEEIDKQIVTKKKRVDATLNKNTRPNRKRKSAAPVEEDDPNDFIDDSGIEQVEVISDDEEPKTITMKAVMLSEKERALADEINKCIQEKNGNKFKEYLRMYARREMPAVVAFETKLAFHFRNQQYEKRYRKKMEQAKKELAEKEKQHNEQIQEIVNDVKESVNFVKKQHGKYELEYQDYVMDHQIDCLSTAINRMMQGKSLLIAHSMGLGKTLTVLLILKNYNRIFSMNKVGKSLKYLVLVPKSNIEHFSKQYSDHFPTGGFLTQIMVMDDNANLYDRLLDFNKGGRMLVTTYDRCMNILKQGDDEAKLLLNADILVIDEAHVIKNPDSERFKQFSAFSKSIKLLVTGTPLQNSIAEIFTLIRFLEPDNPYVKKLKNCFNSTFTDYFSKNRKKIDNREVLARTQVFYNYFKELIHRKVNIKEMEEIVNKKQDIVIEFTMGKEEQDIYDFVTGQYKTKCYFARYFYQRLCLDCIDYLKDRSDEKDLKEFSQDYNDEDLEPESFKTRLEEYIKEKYPDKIPISTRLRILKTLVSQIVRCKKEKVVIFSGLVCYFDSILKELHKDSSIKVAIFTGDTSSAKRAEIINEFKRGNYNTLLISKNAGGVGIDLTTATNVVLFNLDFNFAKDDQAICRLVRKNQTQKVNIFRLVCRASVDVAVKELQAHKVVIFDKLLDDISSIIKPKEKNACPEDLCNIAFGTKTVPFTIKKFIVNIEKFQLTQGSIDLTEDEVEKAQSNIEREMP